MCSTEVKSDLWGQTGSGELREVRGVRGVAAAIKPLLQRVVSAE